MEDHGHLHGHDEGHGDESLHLSLAGAPADEFKTMLVVCLSMFLGALLAGLAWMPLTRSSLDHVNAFGVGLLLGTGLGVIIPEGMRELSTSSHAGEHVVGLALIAGFLAMLLVDHLACCGSAGAHGHSHDLLILPEPKTPLRMGTPNKRNEDVDHVHDDLGDVESRMASSKRRRATITLGLLIHNMADGLAMGASKASRKEWTASQMLVFTAIMMHHIPAAFGFATLLRSSGMEESLVRQRVFVFASAGPVAALIVFIVLHYGMSGSMPKEAVGVCLLFSGGSFLYVAAVHALDEARKGGLLGVKELGLLCVGALLPVMMSLGHEH